MAQANPVVWFEIPVRDFGRATRFYQAAFGFELKEMQMGPSKMAWFPMEPGGAGAGGTLILEDGYVPSHQGTLVYISVTDIDGTLASIGKAGGKTLVPKMSIGEHGAVAQFEDTEGNRVGLHAAS